MSELEEIYISRKYFNHIKRCENLLEEINKYPNLQKRVSIESRLERQREAVRRYYWRNREKILAKNRLYYQKNKDKCNKQRLKCYHITKAKELEPIIEKYSEE